LASFALTLSFLLSHLYVTYFDWKGRKEGAGRQAETDRQAGREEKGGRMEPDRCEKMREKREYEVSKPTGLSSSKRVVEISSSAMIL